MRGFSKGFVGPQGMGQDVIVLADHTVRGAADWVAGANETDKHATGVNTPRDFRVDRWEDVVALRDGDRCPNCGGTLHVARGIVLGHIYQLGTHYSGPLDARFVDEDGSERPYLMGSYGIGISRILAAAIEQFHDDAGLRLPRRLAPFEAVVIVANRDDEQVVSHADRIYVDLRARGVDVVIDDREQAAGVKFNDADLIGYPVQVVVGKRGVQAGTVGSEAARDRRAFVGSDRGRRRRGGRPARHRAVGSPAWPARPARRARSPSSRSSARRSRA